VNEGASSEPVKLAYVMGAGHSGSTILGITLGNCDGFFYAGELEEWLLTAERPRWGASERQQFWSAVTQRVTGAEEIFGGEANRCIERSSAIFRFDLWAARRRMLPAYRRVAAELVRAVADVAQAEYVVDSSHFPLRAQELRELPGIELYLIFLVRDPRDVVASNTRELSPHEVAETRWRRLTMNANLWLTQLLALRTFASHREDRRIFVRHEDFLDDPAGVARQILAMLGSNAALPDLQRLTVGAPLQGNQLIRSDTVAVRSSPRGVARHDPFTALVQLLWRPLLARLHPTASAAGGAR
jgi:hypothetical protein